MEEKVGKLFKEFEDILKDYTCNQNCPYYPANMAEVEGEEKLILYPTKLDKNKEVIEKCELTDFAMMTGCIHRPSPYNESREPKYGPYFTTGKDGALSYTWPSISSSQTCVNHIGIRPVMLLTPAKYVLITKNRNRDGIVQYGEFPQKVVDEWDTNRLEYKRDNRKLKREENFYHFYSPSQYHVEYEHSEDKYRKLKKLPQKYFVYKDEDTGKKYIIRATVDGAYSSCFLSDNQLHCNQEELWVEVNPIEWIVDDASKALISKKILLSGINLDLSDNRIINQSGNGMEMYIDKQSEMMSLEELQSFLNDILLDDMLYVPKPLPQPTLEAKLSEFKMSILQEIKAMIEEKDEIIYQLSRPKPPTFTPDPPYRPRPYSSKIKEKSYIHPDEINWGNNSH